MATSFRIESSVHGHHVYKDVWSPVIGDELLVQVEEHNTFDEFAMATYSCNTCYNLVGNSTRTCQATGNWSENAPTCQGMLLHSVYSCSFHEHSEILLRPFLDQNDGLWLLDDRLPYVWISICFSCLLHHTGPWFWFPNAIMTSSRCNKLHDIPYFDSCGLWQFDWSNHWHGWSHCWNNI